MYTEEEIKYMTSKNQLPEGRWANQNDVMILPNEQEKTYVISWNETVHGKTYGSYTKSVAANTIQEAIDKIYMNGDDRDFQITYIYHD